MIRLLMKLIDVYIDLLLAMFSRAKFMKSILLM